MRLALRVRAVMLAETAYSVAEASSHQMVPVEVAVVPKLVVVLACRQSQQAQAMPVVMLAPTGLTYLAARAIA